MNSRRLSAWQCVIIVRQNCETSAAWDLKMDSSLKNKTIKKKQKFMNIILINWLKVAIQKYFWMLNIYFMSLTGTSTLKNHYDSNPVKVLIWIQLCHKFHIIFSKSNYSYNRININCLFFFYNKNWNSSAFLYCITLT